jgi:hypothetical protein
LQTAGYQSSFAAESRESSCLDARSC